MKTAIALLALVFSLADGVAESPDTETVTVAFEVMQVRPEGIFAKVKKSINWSSSETQLPEDGQLIFITGHPREKDLAEGDVAAGKLTRDGSVEADARKLRRYKCISEFSDRRYF
jgi:hypothetical protein